MNNRQNLNENGNYGYTYAQQPYYTERPERRGGSALSVIAVILAVALMFGYMQMNRDSSRNTAPQVIYQTVPYENRTQTAPAAQTLQNSVSENTATQNENARPTKGTEKTDATLVDLKTIGSNGFGTLFKMEGDVEDYAGNVHRYRDNSTYVVYGDGFGGWFNRKVTFLNPEHYNFLTGKITVAGESDGYNTLDGLEMGYIKLVVLDSKGNPLKGGVELNRTTKEAEFWLDIGGSDEFTIACDCTDGRAGGHQMRMIVEGLTLTK
ncbi:MAG: hypothetical protein II464_09085 [Oscillospiraceae bacterium]|nr:hypothetical protein [Oscillospiraceae bacterium]